MLVGWLFLMPLAGATVGAAGGALGGALVDVGINDQDMKQQANEALKPGTAGLFLLIRKMTTDKVSRSEGRRRYGDPELVRPRQRERAPGSARRPRFHPHAGHARGPAGPSTTGNCELTVERSHGSLPSLWRENSVNV